MDGIPPPTIASILATPAAARVALKEKRRTAPPADVEEEVVEPVHGASAIERVHDDPRHTGSDPDHFHAVPDELGSHLDLTV